MFSKQVICEICDPNFAGLVCEFIETDFFASKQDISYIFIRCEANADGTSSPKKNGVETSFAPSRQAEKKEPREVKIID